MGKNNSQRKGERAQVIPDQDIKKPKRPPKKSGQIIPDDRIRKPPPPPRKKPKKS